MSMSAAMSAAPTKKLTTMAPQAGVRRSAPAGTSGASARRRCTANATAATAEPRRNHRPWSEKTWIRGGEGGDHAGERDGEEQRPDEVGVPHGAHPAAQVEQRPGRRAAPDQEKERGRHRHHAERREPATVPGERDEQPTPAEVAHQG